MTAFNPTPEQRAILNYQPDRHARVLAGPGTGKSATLVALIDRLLDGEPTPRIRLLTFHPPRDRRAREEGLRAPRRRGRATEHDPFLLDLGLASEPRAGDYLQPLRIADDWEGCGIKPSYVPQSIFALGSEHKTKTIWQQGAFGIGGATTLFNLDDTDCERSVSKAACVRD